MEVSEYSGTKETAEKEMGDVGALSEYYYFDMKGAVTQEATFQFITCKITGDEGHVWVVTARRGYDPEGKINGSRGEGLAIWYIENQEGNWYVTRVRETP